MVKDTEGIFVHKEQVFLLGLLNETTGRSVVYVNETAFKRDIRECVNLFYWEE